MIAFWCSACGKPLQAQDDKGGQKIPCQHCGKATLVPATEVQDSNPFQAALRKTLAEEEDTPTHSPLRWVLLGAVVVGVLALSVFAWYRLAPSRGKLVIEAEESAEIIVLQGGNFIVERTRRREFDLPAGEYEIVLANAKEGQRLEQSSITLAPGGREVVKVLQDPTKKISTHAVTADHGPYTSVYGVDSEGLQTWIDGLKKTGHRPISLNGYAVTHGKGSVPGPWGDQHLFAGIAVKDEKKQAWEARHDLLQAEYKSWLEELKTKGYIPTSLSGYLAGGTVRFVGVCETRVGGSGWWTHYNTPPADQIKHLAEHTQQGLGMVQVTGFWNGKETRFTSVYWRSSVERNVVHDLTSDEYTQEVKTQTDKGFRPFCVSGYHRADGTRFAAVFVKDGLKEWEAQHGLTPREYKMMAERLTAKGYRPQCICGHLVEGALRYSTIWVKD